MIPSEPVETVRTRWGREFAGSARGYAAWDVHSAMKVSQMWFGLKGRTSNPLRIKKIMCLADDSNRRNEAQMMQRNASLEVLRLNP